MEPQKRKKLSGAQFRQQKQKKEVQNEKLAGSFLKFLSKPENKETQCQENVDATLTSTALNPEAMEVSENKYICSSPSSNGDFSKTETREGTTDDHVSNSSPSVICSSLDCSNDPGLWPASMNNYLVNILVSRGPVQVLKHNFPANDDGRKFADNYYSRNLPNGEKINSEWLVYSISNDSVCCFCCKIFGKTVSTLSTLNGFSD